MIGSHAEAVECVVSVAELGEQLSGLRLRDAPALKAMRRSLERHGQLSAIVLFRDGSDCTRLELLDGFKRLSSARMLGWKSLRATVRDVDVVAAKAQIAALHDGRGLSEIEEGFIVRSLYRDDGLSQPEIARLLDRHKSWVFRRLLLVEALEPAVQADVRLGLLAPRAAMALAQLPRGNQRAAAMVVIQHGLTVRQTERLAAELLERPDEVRAEWLARKLEVGGAAKPTRQSRGAVDGIATDIATLHRVAARLQARLLATPFGALPAADVLLDALVSLAPVLAALERTVATMIGKEQAA